MAKFSIYRFFQISCTLYALLVTCSLYGVSSDREDSDKWKSCNFSEATCKCLKLDEGSIKADCSHLHLNQVPIFPHNVVWINLQFNSIENISVSYPKNLLYLDLSHNSIFSFKGNPFDIIPRLKYLDLSSNKLSLSENNLFPELFQSLESLVVLNLKNNSVKMQGNWSYTGEILSELILLEELQLDAIDNFLLSEGFYRLKNLSLLDISASRGHCETVKITHNFFSQHPISSTSRYIVLSFSHRNTLLQSSSFERKIKMIRNHLTFQYSHSTNFSTFLHNFRNFCRIEVSHWRPVIYVHIPENLQTIYVNDSRQYSKISQFGLIAPKLRHMFFQNNVLNEWIGPMYGIQNVTLIDLSNNFCTKLSSNFFVNASGLLRLNISRNSVGDNLERDKNGLIFRNLVSVETLDLSSNKIYHLPYLLLKRSRNIGALILNNNQLSELNVGVKHMHHLEHLDLSENRIDSIRDEIRQELTDLIRLKNTSIDLSGNNVDCSCENVPYIQWMVKHKENFERFDDYECAIKSQKNFNFSDPVTSLKSLVVECRSYTTFYIVASIVLTILVFVVIAMLVKRNIWTIRFTIYQCKQKVKTGGRYMQILYQRNRLNFSYDIFISYSARDRELVMNKLLLKLQDLNLDVCIRERDFLAGRHKADNIMDAIESSKMTVCVVSESYLKSGWRDYELNMAKLEGIKKRGGLHYVYLIILPGAYDLKRKCPNSLKDLINENLFCHYPSEESMAELDIFWNDFSSVVAHN
ncbi:toll-like receptor 4 [Saccostrea cucullata]|uniref:toll-like receptor 4 n=1 Tax=Saccostrea cuccullata TaxID=36930 RepID=UPI002ED26128